MYWHHTETDVSDCYLQFRNVLFVWISTSNHNVFLIAKKDFILANHQLVDNIESFIKIQFILVNHIISTWAKLSVLTHWTMKSMYFIDWFEMFTSIIHIHSFIALDSSHKYSFSIDKYFISNSYGTHRIYNLDYN